MGQQKFGERASVVVWWLVVWCLVALLPVGWLRELPRIAGVFAKTIEITDSAR